MQNLRKTDSTQWDLWNATHNYLLSFKGSAPNMEKSGTVKIFEHPTKKHRLRYTSIYENGDTKSSSKWLRLRKVSEKFECKGINKSVLVISCVNWGKRKRLGKNRLAPSRKIDALQNYFGIALATSKCWKPWRNQKFNNNQLFHVSGYLVDFPRDKNAWFKY